MFIIQEGFDKTSSSGNAFTLWYNMEYECKSKTDYEGYCSPISRQTETGGENRQANCKGFWAGD